jgi:stage III sporulation protein SpoIIIAA
VGKTTVIREMARVLSDELGKRVVIIDTSNEIGGDGRRAYHLLTLAHSLTLYNPQPSCRNIFTTTALKRP